jgi:hypothetical protein
MKKFITMSLAAALALMLTACGNMALIDPGNFTFRHIHTDTYHDPMCFTIEKWWDNSEGVEVKTKECGTLYFSEGDYVMVESAEDCPYCDGGKIAPATILK